MKLSKRQRTALEKSITKWEGVVNEGNEDHGKADCNCCISYHRQSCSGCPIKQYTGESNCRSTPYYKFTIYCEEEGENEDWIVFDEKSKQLAQDELNFLRSILAEAS